jgi:hypothetical protein
VSEETNEPAASQPVEAPPPTPEPEPIQLVDGPSMDVQTYSEDLPPNVVVGVVRPPRDDPSREKR